MNAPSETNVRVASILAAYGIRDAQVQQILGGNINETFKVVADGRELILQRLNQIFVPQIHFQIEAVTRHLQAKGLRTPVLIRTWDDELWVTDHHGETWRLLTFVLGRTWAQNATPRLCESAGRHLGAFHAALVDFDDDLGHSRVGVHDTARHLVHLKEALDSHRDHRAYDLAGPLGEEILTLMSGRKLTSSLPERVVHGDPKLDNFVFNEAEKAICLIDLDTVGRMTIPVELGDAFRSWCNVSGEDSFESEFSLPCYRAGLSGYLSTAAPFITPEEAEAIGEHVFRISLELSARFCADALEESYFAWNGEKYQAAWQHHIHRAQSQLNLARSVGRHLEEMGRIVSELWG